MTIITTRSGKGSPLTNTEVDANFTNLNSDKVELDDLSVSTTSASGGGSLSYSNTTGVFTLTPPDLSSYLSSTAIGSTVLAYDENLQSFVNTFTLPTTDGSSGQVLTTNGSGTLTFSTPAAGYSNSDVDTHLNTSTASTNEVLSWNGSDYDWVAQSSGGAELSVLSTRTIDNPTAYSNSSGDNFSRAVAVSGNYAIVGASLEDESGNTNSGKAYIFNVITGSLLHTLDNPNAYSTSAGDQFGSAVAISGNYAIVGASRERDAGGYESGKAYIFDVTTGSLLYTLNNPNAYGQSGSDYFGWSVGISGNHAIVGAYWEDDAGGYDAGKAYIFDISTFTSNTISFATYVLNNPNAYNTSGYDNFGWSVAIDGSYAIVGAKWEDDANGTNAGKAYIYDIDTFTSSTISSANYVLDNPNAYSTSNYDQFGQSVAISGPYAVVGAAFEDDANGGSSGKTYIYAIDTFTSSTISSATYVLDNPSAYSTSSGDQFGQSVAISGNYVIVGAWQEGDAGGPSSGKAYIYDINTFTSSTISNANYVLDNPNAYLLSPYDYFGYAVAISGNYAVVGAYAEDDAGGNTSGKAYFCRTNGTAYIPTPQEFVSFT